MPQVKRTELEYDCPSCKKYVRPYVLEDVPANESARPPIPFRQRVQCPAVDADNNSCNYTWYIVP